MQKGLYDGKTGDSRKTSHSQNHETSSTQMTEQISLIRTKQKRKKKKILWNTRRAAIWCSVSEIFITQKAQRDRLKDERIKRDWKRKARNYKAFFNQKVYYKNTNNPNERPSFIRSFSSWIITTHQAQLCCVRLWERENRTFRKNTTKNYPNHQILKDSKTYDSMILDKNHLHFSNTTQNP